MVAGKQILPVKGLSLVRAPFLVLIREQWVASCGIQSLLSSQSVRIHLWGTYGVTNFAKSTNPTKKRLMGLFFTWFVLASSHGALVIRDFQYAGEGQNHILAERKHTDAVSRTLATDSLMVYQFSEEKLVPWVLQKSVLCLWNG